MKTRNTAILLFILFLLFPSISHSGTVQGDVDANGALDASRGGTNRDSSLWTGAVRVIGGIWSTYAGGGGGVGISACTLGSTLSEVITAIGDTNATITLDCNVLVDSNATSPTNATWVAIRGGRLTYASPLYKARFLGNFYGSADQIIFGDGGNSTHFTLAHDIFPEWWGSHNTGLSGPGDNDTFAVQSAINSAPDTGGKVKLSQREWTFNAEVNKTSLWIEGSWAGNNGQLLYVNLMPRWRAADRTKPIIRVFSDRAMALDPFYPLWTSLRLTNFVMDGSNFDWDNKRALTDRQLYGIHVDNGSRGVRIEHFTIEGYMGYGLKIGMPTTHPITDIVVSDGVIGSFSGFGGFGGLGDIVEVDYGLWSGIVDDPNPMSWVTSVFFKDVMLEQWGGAATWDNSTTYYNDSAHGTSVVREVSDYPADNGTWGQVYVCKTGGVSKSGGQPSWHRTIGEETTDGGVTWVAQQRGRAINNKGTFLALHNVGIEAGNYQGVRLSQEGGKHWTPIIDCLNCSISTEFNPSSSVVVESEVNGYPSSWNMRGNYQFWTGNYKPKDKPSYDPVNNSFTSLTYGVNAWNGFQGWRPTFYDGARFQSFTAGFNPNEAPYFDLYLDSGNNFDTTLASDQNITIYTPAKVTFHADSVTLPEVNNTITKVLTSGTFDGNTTLSREVVTVGTAGGPISLTNINLESDSNLITDWNGTQGANLYEYFHSTASAVDNATETGTAGGALSKFFTVTKGKNYRLTVTLTLKSGQAPYIYAYSGDAASIESGTGNQISNGANYINYTASHTGVAAYVYAWNTAASNWKATFTLHEHKTGIEKILIAGDTNVTLVHNPAYISLRGGVNASLSTVGDMIGLLSEGGIWKETFRNIANDGVWTLPWKIGPSFLWADGNGTLRRKSTAPTADGDGTKIE